MTTAFKNPQNKTKKPLSPQNSSAILFKDDSDDDSPSKKVEIVEQVPDNQDESKQTDFSQKIINPSLEIINIKPMQQNKQVKLIQSEQNEIHPMRKPKRRMRRKNNFNFDSDQEKKEKTLDLKTEKEDKEIKQDETQNRKKETIETAAQSNLYKQDSSQIVEQRDRNSHEESRKNEEFYIYESQMTEQNDMDNLSEGDESSSSDEEIVEERITEHAEIEEEDLPGGLRKSNSSPLPPTSKLIPKTFQANSFSDLLFSRVPIKCSVDCLIICKKDFFSSTRSYDLYLKDEKRYLITAIKNRISITSDFQFKQNPYKYPKKLSLAKLRSNFSGLQYTLTLHPEQPLELLHVEFTPNVLGISMRSVNITQNTHNKRIKIPEIRPFSLMKNYLEIENDPRKVQKFQKFGTKKARKNNKGEFELDFQGVAKTPSVNNIIVEDQTGEALLIIGKISNQMFGMKVISGNTNSISIGQAFAIAVSNLDTKLFVR